MWSKVASHILLEWNWKLFSGEFVNPLKSPVGQVGVSAFSRRGEEEVEDESGFVRGGVSTL